jgi:hypothetical protein
MFCEDLTQSHCQWHKKDFLELKPEFNIIKLFSLSLTLTKNKL